MDDSLKAKLAALRAAKAGATTVEAIDSKLARLEATEMSKEITTIPTPISQVSLTRIDNTSDIDHLEFLTKMNALRDAIHTKHPTMPVLLMQIHKQLTADPEIVTLLNEEGIGIIVKGLEIQTKTELVSVVVKQNKAKDKKTKLELDMF